MFLLTITLVSAILPGLYCSFMDSKDLGGVDVEMGYAGMKYQLCEAKEGYKGFHKIMEAVDVEVQKLKEKHPECVEAKALIVKALKDGYEKLVTVADPSQVEWWKDMNEKICPLEMEKRTPPLQDTIRDEGKYFKSYKCEEDKPSPCCIAFHIFFKGLTNIINNAARRDCICRRPFANSTFTNSPFDHDGLPNCDPPKKSNDPKDCPKMPVMMGRK